jgi:plastocyanin
MRWQQRSRVALRVIGITLLVAVITCAGALMGACSSAPAATSAQRSAVSIVDFSFNSASTTIARGTTVEWTNTGNAPHTATSDTGVWDSGQLAKDGKFSRQFSDAGTFAYHCNIHAQMKGTITVQ